MEVKIAGSLDFLAVQRMSEEVGRELSLRTGLHGERGVAVASTLRRGPPVDQCPSSPLEAPGLMPPTPG